MNPKILFTILALLFALFAAGVGAGAWQGAGRVSGRPPGWVQSLGDLLVSKQRLSSRDIRSASPTECRAQFQRGRFDLAQGQSCTLGIGPSAQSQRSLLLRLSQGSAATITLDHHGPALTARQTLVVADDTKLFLFAEGGRLTLTCDAGGPASACEITVQ